MTNFLKRNFDVFAWTHNGIEGIDPKVMSHRLNVNVNFLPKRQQQKPMNLEIYEGLKEEVDKYIRNGVCNSPLSVWPLTKLN